MATQRRKLETAFFTAEAQIQRTGSDGVGQILCVVRIMAKKGAPKAEGRLEWSSVLKNRLVSAIEDGFVALDLQVRENTREGGHGAQAPSR